MLRWLAMILVALAVVYGIIRFTGRFDPRMAELGQEPSKLIDLMSKPRTDTQIGGTGKYLRAPRPEFVADIQKTMAISLACKPYASEIQKLDLLQMMKDRATVSYQMLPALPRDCQFQDKRTAAALKSFLERCQPKERASEPITEECSSHLFMLRAALTRQLYSDRVLGDIDDLRVLTDMMFAEFVPPQEGEMPNYQDAKKVSERMLEIDPQLFVAAKVSSFVDVIDGLVRKSQGQASPQFWEQAQKTLDRAKTLNPNDPALAEVEAAIETQGFDPTLTQSYIERVHQQGRESGSSWYLKAYTEWKLGKPDDARASLKRAIALSPGNSQYAQTMVAIDQEGANSESFQGILSFGIDSKDFER